MTMIRHLAILLTLALTVLATGRELRLYRLAYDRGYQDAAAINESAAAEAFLRGYKRAIGSTDDGPISLPGAEQ